MFTLKDGSHSSLKGDLYHRLLPVSYTHLDVYKRQGEQHPDCPYLVGTYLAFDACRLYPVRYRLRTNQVRAIRVLLTGSNEAAKGMVQWARENAKSSGLEQAPIRWIVDDCAKFVEREIRRGRRYDAIIMDPPSYGRGPTGEVWKLEENLYPFVELVREVLSDQPLFLILNSYTTGLAPSVITYILETLISRRFGGHTVSQELGLPVTESGLALPCGATGRWTRE